MNSLKTLTAESLLTETQRLCTEERRITAEVLLHLAEIESRRLYAEMGYGSLFAFAIKELRYSEGAAGRRISAMRLMRQLPEIEKQVRDGTLNVTVVSMAKHATDGRPATEKRQVLEQLKDQSQCDAERTLATLYPAAAQPRERERAITDTLTQITFSADPALLTKLNKLRGLLSHKNPNATHQELLHLITDELLKRIDPERSTRTPAPAPEKQRETKTAPDCSRYIPRATRRAIWREAEAKCSYMDPQSSRRCESTHLLQIDHIEPRALGGGNTLTNLRLLCRSHNLLAAEKLGLRKA